MKDTVYRLDAVNAICNICGMTPDPSSCKFKYGDCEKFRVLRRLPSARREIDDAVRFVEESLTGVYCDTCQYQDSSENWLTSTTPCESCHRKSMGWSISHEAALSLVNGIMKYLDCDDEEQ